MEPPRPPCPVLSRRTSILPRGHPAHLAASLSCCGSPCHHLLAAAAIFRAGETGTRFNPDIQSVPCDLGLWSLGCWAQAGTVLSPDTCDAGKGHMWAGLLSHRESPPLKSEPPPPSKPGGFLEGIQHRQPSEAERGQEESRLWSWTQLHRYWLRPHSRCPDSSRGVALLYHLPRRVAVSSNEVAHVQAQQSALSEQAKGAGVIA